MWQFILAGLSLGMLSGFHCIGMCGPIAVALPVNQLSKSGRIAGIFFYHGGRVITYMLIGLLFSLMGRSIYIAGWQQYLSIGLGILFLTIATSRFFRRTNPHPAFATKFYRPVQKAMAYALGIKKLPGLLLLGIVNGLLPCGMVYIAVAASLTAASVWQGMAFMGFYGIGTLPLMMLLSFFSYKVHFETRNYLKKLFPVVIALMGVIFILRGLNLGIPFISPIMPEASAEPIKCH